MASSRREAETPAAHSHGAATVVSRGRGRRALERAAGFFRAVGDVERLRLLEVLADREWCVTELAEALGHELSSVSQRLRVLRAERLVKRRREGKHIHYRLADRHVAALLESALEHAAEGDDDDY